MASAWNLFVKKIYHEGHNKDKSYSFKQALQDASKRKSEMGSSKAAPMGKRTKKSKKGGKKGKSRRRK
jgi:hypothetical protein